jgi:sporulation protein YlmC with PRC-barrel domain
MADYDRYDSRTLDRDRTRGSNRYEDRQGRGDDSIFNFGGGRDRDRNRDRDPDRDRFGGNRGMGAGAASYRSRERSGGTDRNFGPDDEREGLARDETGHLIASNKVEGTAVYGRDGERLGDIYNFMVDKRSGHVEYAVMSYGGFLGMGMRYYPLPWDMLSYDTRQGGYRVQLTERDLESAPSFDRNSEPRYDRSYSGRVHDYYGIRY